ncbi:MAG TPA: MFS transporter [Thermoplasmata archaeon]|nr:MFS transporter [Thermoplasmata archaeon]
MSNGAPPPVAPDGPVPKTAATFDRAYAIRIMAIMSILVMIVMYIEGMLTPSLYSIATEFHVSVAQVSLILSVYLVTGVALTPIAGKLGDVYGKKRVLTAILVFYALAVSVTGFSRSYEFMVASRAVQGVGLTIFPLAMSLVREEFPREMVPRAQGILSGLFGAGFAVSLPLGAFVSNTYGWRFTYHSAIPVVAGLTVAAFLYLRESPYRRPDAFVDYAGAGFLAASLGLIVLGLSQGPAWGWTSPSVLGLLIGGVVLLVPTAVVEFVQHRRGKDVILDAKMLRRRNVLVTNLVVVVSGFGMFLAFQALTFRLEYPVPVGFGLDIFQTGLSFVAFAVPMLVFAPLASVAVTRVGTRPMTIVGCLIAAVGFWSATLGSNVTQMLESMFVIGAGIAVMNSSVINLLVLTVEPQEMGLATSLNAVFRNVGSSVGAPLAGSLMSTFTVVAFGQRFPSPTAFHDAFLIAAVASVLAGGLVVFAHEILGNRAVRAGQRLAGPTSPPASSRAVSEPTASATPSS